MEIVKRRGKPASVERFQRKSPTPILSDFPGFPDLPILGVRLTGDYRSNQSNRWNGRKRRDAGAAESKEPGEASGALRPESDPRRNPCGTDCVPKPSIPRWSSNVARRQTRAAGAFFPKTAGAGKNK